MGEVRREKQAKLFIGVLSSDQAVTNHCEELLIGRFGPLEYRSDPVPWESSGYYEAEMGSGLTRTFLFFRDVISEGGLPGIKLATNELEAATSRETAAGRKRRINLDPGYVTEAKVVLASTKDFSHRLYVGKHIYAEVTLRYHSKERCFGPLEYTYPEYKTSRTISLFNAARDRLRAAIRSSPAAAP